MGSRMGFFIILAVITPTRFGGVITSYYNTVIRSPEGKQWPLFGVLY